MQVEITAEQQVKFGVVCDLSEHDYALYQELIAADISEHERARKLQGFVTALGVLAPKNIIDRDVAMEVTVTPIKRTN
jgi:hypothetical protein